MSKSMDMKIPGFLESINNFFKKIGDIIPGTSQELNLELNKDIVIADILDLLTHSLKKTEIAIKPTARFSEDLKIDSLTMLELLIQLEDRFQIEIPAKLYNQLFTVQDLCDYVTKELKL